MFINTFLKIILIIVFFQSSAKTDDIKDFEIDGMSIGDSLLNHFTEKEIIEATDESHKGKEFILKTIWSKNSSIYEVYQVVYKRLDKKKELHGIVGVISFPNNINKCKKQMKKISSELSILFPLTEKKNWGKYDMSEGHYFPITFTFKDNTRAMVACFNWSKKSGIDDNLKVSLYSYEYREYLAKQKQ